MLKSTRRSGRATGAQPSPVRDGRKVTPLCSREAGRARRQSALCWHSTIVQSAIAAAQGAQSAQAAGSAANWHGTLGSSIGRCTQSLPARRSQRVGPYQQLQHHLLIAWSASLSVAQVEQGEHHRGSAHCAATKPPTRSKCVSSHNLRSQTVGARMPRLPHHPHADPVRAQRPGAQL